MKNVSKIALAVFAAVGLAACSSNNGGGSVEHFANYSKTEQGKNDLTAIKANQTEAQSKTAAQVEGIVAQKGEAFVIGSKSDTQQYAQFGVFRTGVTEKDVGELRYSVVSTKENKLDAAKALAVLSAKNNEGDDYKENIEAEYRGKLAYSAKEKGKDGKEHLEVRVANLTLNLHNDKIGGEAKDGDKKRNFIFEAADIYNNGGELAYSGKLTVVTGEKVVDAKTEVGSYHGFFASDVAPVEEKGKETYADVKAALKETAGKIDTPSFHGAFDGKKQGADVD